MLKVKIFVIGQSFWILRNRKLLKREQTRIIGDNVALSRLYVSLFTFTFIVVIIVFLWWSKIRVLRAVNTRVLIGHRRARQLPVMVIHCEIISLPPQYLPNNLTHPPSSLQNCLPGTDPRRSQSHLNIVKKNTVRPFNSNVRRFF